MAEGPRRPTSPTTGSGREPLTTESARFAGPFALWDAETYLTTCQNIPATQTKPSVKTSVRTKGTANQ